MEALRRGSRLSFMLRHWTRVGKINSSPRCACSSNGSSERSGKYKEFKDEESTEILDVFEERIKIAETISEQETLDDEDIEQVDRLDIEELVELIKSNRGKDVAVLKIPAELAYVEYMIVVTCQSRRHIQGLGETIRKHAKTRLNDMRKVPKMEGSQSEWIALDFGNLCVHIMDRTLRESYDLESLWGVGAKYDTLLHRRDEDLLSLLKKHSISSIGDTNKANTLIAESS